MSRRFFLTGATGVVGLSILEQLNEDDQVSILVNRQRFSTLPTGVIQQVQGDISKPDFGISAQELAQLNEIDVLIHSAALTDFTADADVLADINIAGLQHAKALANKLNAKLIYISTAFVQGRNGHAFNNYEHSKKLAESSLDDDVTVIRPSVIIGDSIKGIMPKKQGMHNMLKLATKEVIPVVPGDASTLVDVIPRDTVASGILTVVDNNLSGEFWLTAGDDASTLGQMLTIGTNPDYFERYQVKFKPPKLINPTTFERLIKPVFLPALPRRYKRMFEETSIYLKYLDMSEGFSSDLELLGKYDQGPKPFDIPEVMVKNIAAFDDIHPLSELLVVEGA
ncbi:hypothetical protein PCIT_b0224 [Pseudoalteromonas citrea]|uniref:Thioester reductase (TE) domain-containing protein n=2 Tax=Pseudoalteromonas citrea TaxID=43655 RepID=A0AAD4FPS2_9GAMM|nr:SDR family oxidoreductase [Pseudoalteromonas citrea]KAF7764269.1 hypothetical protein PCIT_b0224 [Pseudoalteromonas citrea]